jgi:hypothetical protein
VTRHRWRSRALGGHVDLPANRHPSPACSTRRLGAATIEMARLEVAVEPPITFRGTRSSASSPIDLLKAPRETVDVEFQGRLFVWHAFEPRDDPDFGYEFGPSVTVGRRGRRRRARRRERPSAFPLGARVLARPTGAGCELRRERRDRPVPSCDRSRAPDVRGLGGGRAAGARPRMRTVCANGDVWRDTAKAFAEIAPRGSPVRVRLAPFPAGGGESRQRGRSVRGR